MSVLAQRITEAPEEKKFKVDFGEEMDTEEDEPMAYTQHEDLIGSEIKDVKGECVIRMIG